MAMARFTVRPYRGASCSSFSAINIWSLLGLFTQENRF